MSGVTAYIVGAIVSTLLIALVAVWVQRRNSRRHRVRMAASLEQCRVASLPSAPSRMRELSDEVLTESRLALAKMDRQVRMRA